MLSQNNLQQFYHARLITIYIYIPDFVVITIDIRNAQNIIRSFIFESRLPFQMFLHHHLIHNQGIGKFPICAIVLPSVCIALSDNLR